MNMKKQYLTIRDGNIIHYDSDLNNQPSTRRQLSMIDCEKTKRQPIVVFADLFVL